MTVAPLRIEFEVACTPDHAFATWTSRIDTWWPADHTVTADPDLQLVLQSGVGGRIFERTPDGSEYSWGEVTVWVPPHRLAYLWHLGRDRADATEVEIRFTANGDVGTKVEIEHRGWERLGTSGGLWRERNAAGWNSLLPWYIAAVVSGRPA